MGRADGSALSNWRVPSLKRGRITFSGLSTAKREGIWKIIFPHIFPSSTVCQFSNYFPANLSKSVTNTSLAKAVHCPKKRGALSSSSQPPTLPTERGRVWTRLCRYPLRNPLKWSSWRKQKAVAAPGAATRRSSWKIRKSTLNPDRPEEDENDALTIRISKR